MSFNRKRKLRNITAAILGAVSMGGGLQTQATGTENQHNEGTNWAKWGVLSTGALGLGGLGLAAYNALKGPSVDEVQRKIALIQLEEAEKEHDDAKALEQAKKILNCSEQDLTDINTDIQAVAENHVEIARSTLARAFSTESGQRIWKQWTRAGAGVAGQAALVKALAEETSASLTEEKVSKFFGSLKDGNINVDDNTLYYTQLAEGVGFPGVLKVPMNGNRTANAQHQSAPGIIVQDHGGADVLTGRAQLTIAVPAGPLGDISSTAKKLIKTLLPESVAELFPEGISWSINAIAKGDQGHSNDTLDLNGVKRSWTTSKEEQPEVETNGERLVWLELGQRARQHNVDNRNNVIAGGKKGADGKTKPNVDAKKINQAMALGFAKAKQER